MSMNCRGEAESNGKKGEHGNVHSTIPGHNLREDVATGAPFFS